MSDCQFQYTSNQNQFQNNYDGRKTLSVDIKYIFVVLSRILAREYTVFCMASEIGLYMNHQFLRSISLDFLSSTKIQYKETNYDADNIANNK